MLSIKNLGIISAAIIGFYNYSPVMAETPQEDLFSSFNMVPRGIMNAAGELTHASDKDEVFKKHCEAQDQAALNQDNYKNGWVKYAQDSALATAQFTAQKLWDATSYTGRIALAWNINYYGLETIEEAIAYTAYGVGTVVGGSPVGSSAYYATKGTLKVARFIIPGFEGYLSGTLSPITKNLIVDPVINYGPSAVKKAAQVGVAGAKSLATGITSLYSYFRG